MNAALILIAIAVLAFALTRKRAKTPSAPILPTGWRIAYSTGFPAEPTMQGAGWVIDFPIGPTSHLHYVQGPAVLDGTLSARLTVSGGPFRPIEQPESAPLVSLVIFGRDGSRWYSRKAWPLVAGTIDLSAPLAASAWGGVNGEDDPAGFAAALTNPDCIAFAFGHETGRGHGVYAIGPSRIAMDRIG